MRRRALTLLEVIIVVGVLAILAALAVPWIAGLLESHRINNRVALLEGDLELAKSEARTYGSGLAGAIGTGVAPAEGVRLVVRVVKKVPGQAPQLIREHDLGSDLKWQLNDQVARFPQAGGTDSGVAFHVGQAGPSFTPDFSIPFAANGQPVRGSAGPVPLVLPSPALITVGTARRAVTIEISPAGNIRTFRANPNPF